MRRHPLTDLDTALQLQGSTDRNRPSRIFLRISGGIGHVSTRKKNHVSARRRAGGATITLSGALTRDALTAANLFHDFECLWSVGGALTQPIFEGGALRAQSRAARDAFTAQADAYREVVLAAFGQVADSLRALEHDEDRVAAFRHALRIAGDSLALQRISYAAGKTTVLQLIDAERTYSQVMLGMASAQVQQFEDAANLLVAVGGGWWNTSVAPAG